MLLHSYNSRDPKRLDFYHNPPHSFPCSSPCKLLALHFSCNSMSFLGFNLLTQHSLLKGLDCCSLYPVSPCLKADKLMYNDVNLSGFRQDFRGVRGFVGFKLIKCNSRTLSAPTRIIVSGKRKKYGGELPSILRSLESGEEVGEALSLYYGRLSPKEQTVILKEQGSWEKVLRVFEWMKLQKEYVPNVIHYNVVLRKLGRAQKWDELRLCWSEMAKKGLLPSNNTYSMLVDVYGKAGLVKEAVLWIKHMKFRGMFPDEVTMSTVVKVLKDAREYDVAIKFYKDWCVGKIDLDSFIGSDNGSSLAPMSFKHFLSTELFRIGGRSLASNALPVVDAENSAQKPRLTATYNTLIDLYGKAGRLTDAADVFAEMLKSGVAVDTVTFNTMIFTCGSHGHISEAESLLGKMEERGVSPDTKTYNIFLSLYADAGNIDAAIKCYRKIRDVGLRPDVVTHRAILQVLCERRMVELVEAVIMDITKSGARIDKQSLPVIIKMYVNEGLTDRAKHLFEKYQFDGGLKSCTYAAIIDVYAEKGFWAEAEAVFYCKRDLVGQKKDVVEYNVMFKAYGKAKLYDRALSLFKSMRSNGTWPDECSYNTLIQMLSGGDLVDQARDLLSEMQGAGFKPQCITFSSLVGSYSRLGRLSDAVSIYREMVAAGVKPNEVVFGSIIDGYAEIGEIEDALHYFHVMEECGVSANQIVLTSLVKAYSKVGSVEGAKQVYMKMKDFPDGPDIIATNSMLNLYADLGMISEARLIFNNLIDKGWADGVSFATMMYLYKNMGMLDEAIDVAEEMRHSGLLRDCVSYNKVMACYATNGQLVECGELLHDMVNENLLPDAGTFKVLFTILKKGGIPSEAVSQLHSSYREGKPYSREAVLASVYSVVGLHAFALKSCESFLKEEVLLDSSAYNVAIYAYGATGRTNEALNIFMKMQDEGLEPDIVTFINLVGCYGRAGMLEGVKRIHSRLKYGEIDPSESLFKAVIDAYRNANRHDLAELVTQEMKFAFDTETDPVSQREEVGEESPLDF
ncbi:hypothetical protein DCAR_0104709 [Daucus carota subsp. sativus]|uniref:Pentacotripeptide-repeat region of PRORP domain-containing protein n=1 Tax=Daucus carota subsp. sativus TaxID=79200 RepID=A0AAF0W969_DAUCS|nr:PREDICTED: pentatricopeptide repeat-containing protein At1g73710 isoform X1 [Daucus carota subsp. sativus]WOG85519.1 hypothetical protein DCAR_0104709 [Daucus carota subsp. sativus]